MKMAVALAKQKFVENYRDMCAFLILFYIMHVGYDLSPSLNRDQDLKSRQYLA
jgi:hypothetical protein